MAKRKADDLFSNLGTLVGEELAAGVAEGLAASLEQIRLELEPLRGELVTLMKAQILAGARAEATDEPLDDFGAEGMRNCTEPGCARKAVARNLCRRHYARLVYQERKERMGLGAVVHRARRPEPRASHEDRKIAVAPVAPIVRRRKSEAEEAAVPHVAAAAAAAPAAEVTAASVARFFGLGK